MKYLIKVTLKVGSLKMYIMGTKYMVVADHQRKLNYPLKTLKSHSKQKDNNDEWDMFWHILPQEPL